MWYNQFKFVCEDAQIIRKSSSITIVYNVWYTMIAHQLLKWFSIISIYSAREAEYAAKVVCSFASIDSDTELAHSCDIVPDMDFGNV